MNPSPRPTNLLVHEKSPYLLQHQHNPVAWHPWNPAAFERAQSEDKPVFLSIGYSTCHWCHVMERESFEDEALARFLNDHFVAIKLDREERPDVDKIYMSFVQATGGQGGWPLNVFLTPDRKPFYGGTYFPPEPRHGRPSFRQLLEHIHQLWKTRQSEVVDSANDLHLRLEASTRQQPEGILALDPAVLHQAARQFKREYDPQHGGFGGAPKFPRPSQPSFLLRYGVRFHDEESIRMVLHTCERMAAGGMHDQLGGGFARYSVDAGWLVPHFEKMLYDNAQLIHLYLDAWLLSGNDQFAGVARDTIRYVLRDMTHPGGGFYSAEDADSEGKEGKFYCWTMDELTKLLTPEELKVSTRFFGVTQKGNFIDHSDPDPLPGQNILSVVNPQLSGSERELLDSARTKMLDARSQRVRPHLDDKVLSSWNGMMLGAIARASAVLGNETYRSAAERNLAFLKAKLWDANPGEGGTLFHRWRDGERDSVQLLDAYAFLLAGVLDLYEATLKADHLEFALTLADAMIARFYDDDQGGFWQSADDTGDLILRVKEDYDGAIPSGNSVAVRSLLRLAAIAGRSDLRAVAEKTLQLFASRLHQLPQAVPALLEALDIWLDEAVRIVVIGDPGSAAHQDLLRAAHSTYVPNRVVLGNRGPVESFSRTLPAKGDATAYLCTGTACQPPVTTPEALRAVLGNGKGR